jgi:hypothetical protein
MTMLIRPLHDRVVIKRAEEKEQTRRRAPDHAGERRLRRRRGGREGEARIRIKTVTEKQ